MADKSELIAYHGWGFDRHCWDAWKKVIPFGTKLKCYDRGYFGDAASVDFAANGGSKIVFAHSFGLHLCPADLLSRADLLVIFGGFITFHPQAAQFKRRSRFVVQQMIQQMQNKPQTVLHEFWKNAYHPQQAPDLETDHLNRTVLLNDLRSLNESALNPESLNTAGKICILHGARDGIVPKEKGRQLYGEFLDNSTYFEVKDAGHALPFTHVNQCWAFIKPKIREIVES